MESRIVGPDGTPAIVTKRGNMRVLSIENSAYHHALMHGRAFSMLTMVPLTGTSETDLMFLQNLDAREDFLFVLDSVTFSSNAAVKVIMYAGDPTYTSGGADATPANVNGASTLTANVSAKYSPSTDLIVDKTQAGPFRILYLPANQPVEAPTLIAIPNGKTGCITATGASGNVVIAHLNFHFEDQREHVEF